MAGTVRRARPVMGSKDPAERQAWYDAEDAARDAIDWHDADDFDGRDVQSIGWYIQRAAHARDVSQNDVRRALRFLRPGWV